MEKEEIPARTPGIDRRAAPGNRAETHPADLRSILALQRSAGNRAVGSLLAYAPRARVVGRATQLDLPVQREPEEPETEEPETRPILWPEDTEAERNEPCFNGEDQGKISIGFAWADSAAADLTAMPPNLPVAVSTLEAADQSWAATRGTNPGKAQLDGARSTIGRELTRVGTRVEPVGAQLDLAQNAALDASAEASAASTMMTTPKPPEDPEEAQEEPEPCFQEGEQAVIAEAVNLADAAAAELGKRPPNYRRALASLRSAAAKLDGVGGMEPGGPRLAAAAASLGRVVDGVDAYVTPVEAVVAEAAANVRNASDDARGAAELVKPGPYAAGGSAEPPPGG